MHKRTHTNRHCRPALGRLAALSAALVAVASAAPAAAHAGTLAKVTTPTPKGIQHNLAFTSAPGEDNRLLAAREGSGKVRFEDSVQITSYPTDICQSVAPHTLIKLSAVVCDSTGIDRLHLFAGDGDNQVVVTGSYPALVTGAGAVRNSFTGGTGNDALFGGATRDDLDGGFGDDRLQGESGNDSLDGGPGADVLLGGGGADTLEGAGHSDVMRGGPGIDLATYATRFYPVRVSLDDAANDGKDGEGDNVDASVENVTGGRGADELVGQAGVVANTLRGGLGNDAVSGGGGSDYLWGDQGNDPLSGGAGDDHLYGNAGRDDLDGGSGADVLDAGDGADLMRGGPGADFMRGGDDLDRVSYASSTAGVGADPDNAKGDDGTAGEKDSIIADVEELVGSPFDDTLVGSSVRNRIWGGGGADRITGGGGIDELLGEAGNDTMLSADGVADDVLCGTGTDRADADAIDTVAGCEPDGPRGGPGAGGDTKGKAGAPGLTIGPGRVRLTARGIARLRVACPVGTGASCTGTLKLRRKIGRGLVTVGKRRFSVAAGRRVVVRVRIARAVRVELTGAGMRVRAIARMSDTSAAGDPVSRRVRILPAR